MLKLDLVEEIRELRANLNTRIEKLKAHLEMRFSKQDVRLQFVLWMLGIVVTMQVGVLWMLFRVLSQ